jgi:hypothetical protein
VCETVPRYFQEIHSSFLSLSHAGQREMSRKIGVLETSLKKVETVCYNINVRSTEIPKHLVSTLLVIMSFKHESGGEKMTRVPKYLLPYHL